MVRFSDVLVSSSKRLGRRRFGASNLEDGGQDHHRLFNAHEQGLELGRLITSLVLNGPKLEVLVHRQSRIHSMVEVLWTRF